MTEYDAILFDNDGVLVELTDTEVLRRAARRAFESVGVDDPPESLVRHAVNGDVDALAAVEDRFDVPVDEYWAARERRAVEHQREAIRNGGKPLFDDVTALAALPHPKAVVSNNQQGTVEFIVEHYGLAEHFAHVHGRDPTVESARRRKPDPDYIERVTAELGVEDALYVGDSPTDVVAADAAGADSAFLRRDHREPVAVDPEPTYRVGDLNDLVAALRV